MNQSFASYIDGSIELLEGIFGPMPLPRKHKCQQLMRLAAESSKTGDIVELGTFHGLGAAALRMGSSWSEGGYRQVVYTVDDWEYKRGWFGEHYGPKDEFIFLDNMVKLREAGVVDAILQVPWPIVRAASEIMPTVADQRFSLLFWDPGAMGKIEEHFRAWEPNLTHDAIVVFHDTGDGRLGALDLCKKLLAENRFTQYDIRNGGMHVLS